MKLRKATGATDMYLKLALHDIMKINYTAQGKRRVFMYSKPISLTNFTWNELINEVIR